MTNDEAVEKGSEEVKEAEPLPVSRDYYTVSDIAGMVELSRQRIHQIIDAGKLKPDIITANEFIFKAKTVEKFMARFKRRAW
jgi:DNA-binding XRE family transcriptional regulator